jgi:hypothetical protein
MVRSCKRDDEFKMGAAGWEQGAGTGRDDVNRRESMNLLSFVSDIFKPVSDLISEAIEDEDKANEIRFKMFELQMNAASQATEYQKQLLEAQSSIVLAEAQGQSWMQRNWRPITMLTFLVLVCADSFGLLAFRLSNEAWTLLQIGLGGYVVGRSAEKIAPKVMDGLKK